MKKVRTLFAAAFVVGLAAAPLQAQQAQFGYQVVVDGDQVIVSEPLDPAETQDTPATPRTVRVYSRSGDTWEVSDSFQAPNASGPDLFGRSLLLVDDRLYVGATGKDVDGDGEGDGTVYVYRRSGDSWSYDSEFRPESVPMGTSFGRFSSSAGDLLVISALGYNNGGAWVFERDASGAWVEAAILEPSDPDPVQEFFGWGVHTDGERVIVGAFAGQQLPGAAYIFGRDENGAWTQEARLALPDDESQPLAALINGNATLAVGIAGDNALLGLPNADGGRGTVLHFHRRSTGWVRVGSLAAFDRHPNSFFGAAFHGHEGRLLVAAPGANRFGALYALTWDPTTETFTGAEKIRPGEGSDVGDGFGVTGSFGESIAAVGQPFDDSQLGSVVIMNTDDWEVAGKLFIPEERRELMAMSDVECSGSGSADQFGCESVDVLSFMPLDEIGATDRGIETNDVWGWTDPQTGREYALIGRTNGTSFIDVSDPTAPIYLGDLPKTPGSQTNSWRDVKVYDNHAFVVADGAGQHGMQVFDLTRLRDVTNAPATFEPDALYDGIASAHNIVINEAVGRAYAVGSNSGGETCGGGYHMIDISDPLSPTFDGCFQDTNTGFAGTGYSHDAMCLTYEGPDQDYVGREICIGSNENALSIADVTDPDNTVAISNATYPGVEYAHQGWITPDGRYFYMNDEGDEGANQTAMQQDTTGTVQEMAGTRTLIWDVSDLDDPVMVKEHFGETLTIDHNLYIVDDLMYQSNYVSGLRVLDISDPENPVEVGHFDTVPWDESVTFDGSWSNYPFFESGTVVVSSGKEGVFFLKYRRPELVP